MVRGCAELSRVHLQGRLMSELPLPAADFEAAYDLLAAALDRIGSARESYTASKPMADNARRSSV